MPMTAQESYDLLVEQVHAPVFFQKLAQVYNLTPSSHDEAIRLLKMAGKLRNAYEHEAVKTAQQRVNNLDRIDDSLDNILSAYGYEPHEQNENVKAAAAAVLQYPQIRDAVATLSQHLNQQA